MSLEPKIVRPDPGRMIEGLRDTGYEFNTAVADIIDNSIAANAKHVHVRLEADYRGNIRVYIIDDGHGMDKDGLLNAMKYGSKARPNLASLGKFGLGLKTASTAFCRRLSVISRPPKSGTTLQATWDLDHVEKREDWELLFPAVDTEALKYLNLVAPNHSGTVVLWENVDRLMKTYKYQKGGHAQRGLKKIIFELQEHIALVYQRFLDVNDNRAPNVEIKLNGERISPWDPFCLGFSDKVAEADIETESGDGKKATFHVAAYILPRKEEFPTDDDWVRSKLGNERQGIYIYRENRLIHDADWLGMFTKEPHGSLLRVEFSFDHKLDEAFHIDIKKSQIILNQELWNYLKDEFLTAPRREADNRYRRGIQKLSKAKALGSHTSSNNNIRSKEEELETPEINVQNPDTGECVVTNKQGTFTLKLNVKKALKPGEVFVEATDDLTDNVLFEPAIIDGHKAVRINTAHPYYYKVYIPNLTKGPLIQGMDSLLWSLCIAEYTTISPKTAQTFKEMRFEVSRLLRALVEDLPAPELDNEAAA